MRAQRRFPRRSEGLAALERWRALSMRGASNISNIKRVAWLLIGGLATGSVMGCGGSVNVGSDVLWSAELEGGDFREWTDFPGGFVSTQTSPPSTAEVSPDRVHRGGFAAKLTIDAGAGAGQQNVVLGLKGDLPAAAFYSAWYYVPRTTTVDGFWVLFKIRRRDVASDPSTEGELFDVDLVSTAMGEMALQLYDHRSAAAVPLRPAEVIIPVGTWFQLEAFYRNAPDASGHFTLWVDGREVADLGGAATSRAAWVEWSVTSIGDSLDPSTAVVYADDCAVSRTRVGPDGVIGP
jgi:hypothetical protein